MSSATVTNTVTAADGTTTTSTSTIGAIKIMYGKGPGRAEAVRQRPMLPELLHLLRLRLARCTRPRYPASHQAPVSLTDRHNAPDLPC